MLQIWFLFSKRCCSFVFSFPKDKTSPLVNVLPFNICNYLKAICHYHRNKSSEQISNFENWYTYSNANLELLNKLIWWCDRSRMSSSSKRTISLVMKKILESLLRNLGMLRWESSNSCLTSGKKEKHFLLYWMEFAM